MIKHDREVGVFRDGLRLLQKGRAWL